MGFRLTETKPMIKKHKGTPEESFWKNIDAYYKVILNGTSGHLDSKNSWLRNSPGIMKVRAGGQLTLLYLIDLCWQKKIRIISANTDGVELILTAGQEEMYDAIIKRVEEKFNIIFEHENYNKIIYHSVNSYLAVTDKGTFKEKGEFIRKPSLGDSTDFLIIPHLLHDYFVKNIPPNIAIHNYNDIFLFCASQKVAKKFSVWHNGKKLPQRLNRYYASTNGAYLYRDKTNHLLKDSGVTIYNNHVVKPINEYKINYAFYLKKVNDMIAKLKNLNQTALF